eukprot:Seg3245.3 transcript_id=Seg3245.3/GoldUCD/mRNA.D3Y31 product="hypothetical protein" protein_id=Seg3245.3/GoldUCD/D3Y31
MMDARNMLPDHQCNAVGRILLHGSPLCGYLPYYLSPSILFWLLARTEPSNRIMLQQFCESIGKGDGKIVREAIKMEVLTHEAKLHLAVILGQYGLDELPNKDNLEHVFESLAGYTVLINPFRYLSNLRHPIADMAFLLFSSIIEVEISAMLQWMLPTGMQVVTQLHVNNSRDDASSRGKSSLLPTDVVGIS